MGLYRRILMNAALREFAGDACSRCWEPGVCTAVRLMAMGSGMEECVSWVSCSAIASLAYCSILASAAAIFNSLVAFRLCI